MVKKKKVEDQPKEKVVRNDVKQRKEDNKNTEFTCIKSSWKSFCKNNLLADTIVKDILPKINIISFLSYKLLNYHFARLLEENKPLPEIKQNLFYQSCCMVSQLKYTKDNTDTTCELYKSFSQMKEYITDDLPSRDYLCLGYITNLNKLQITMTNNHLKLNFYNRFRKYLKLRTGETDNAVVYNWLKDIYQANYDGKNVFVLYMRKWLKYIPTEVNIVKHSNHFVKIYYSILKEFEKYPDTKGIRTFNLLPHKHGFTQSHITICNAGLENTLKYIANELKRANNDSNSGLDVKKFEENSNEYWKELFNITKYETKNKKFGYTILTDGKSVVLQMRKPTQPEIIATEYTEQQYDNFLGIDPGIRSLITSYDTNDKVIQVSTREYRHKSKMIYACKKRENWYKRWEHYEAWKHIPTIKTSKTSVMKEYFKYVFPRMQTFTEFHIEKGFRNLNFTSYCRSKATLAKICERISGGKNVKTLVGFGDYSHQHGLVKSHPTTPILRLKRELRRYCKVVDIDEYKTSKTCSSCNKEIELYRNRIQRKKNGVLEPIAKMSNIHSVIRCKHNECKLCCMDRDINASKNILGLLLGQYRGEERPLCFTPEKIVVKPRKSDKRAKACNSPLLT
jgi:transposase